MSIDIAKLLPGDIVFPYTGVDLAIPGTNAGHVMIVGATDKAGIATQIHQVAKSMTNTVADTGSQRERLVPNSPKPPGMSSSRKRVVRCRNENLRQDAARLALYWQRWFQFGFSDNRRTNATVFENMRSSKSAAERVSDLRAHFRETGMFRAIKYAARRNGFLCYPNESGESGQGMYCSMFVAICYQVAGISDVVRTADVSDPLLRVSDKKMSEKDLTRVRKQMGKAAMACDVAD